MTDGINNIIFDLGGVILPIDISRTTDAFKKLGVHNIEEFFAHGHASSFFKDLEQGLISDEEFIDEVKKLVKQPLSSDTVTEAWNALLLDYPRERIDLLKELKSKFRLFLFSNTNGIHHTAFQRQFLDKYGHPFNELFEFAWYSHLIKKRKPDVEAFRYVLAEAGIAAGETVFIDDSLNNVEGAYAAGIRGVYLEPGKTIMDLAW